MKICVKLFLLIFLFFALQPCFAKDLKVLVLPDSLTVNQTNYFIYPDASELVANDIINYLNIVPGLNATTVSYVQTVMDKDIKIKKVTEKTLTDFKTNYSLDFASIRRINSKFNADMVLLITSNIDTQNYFLRRTWWDFINIPGATVIDPAYRLSTQMYLINPKTDIVLWQNNYQKLISSRENRMIANNFSPEPEQMERIKMYSKKFLAPQVTQEIQLVAYKVDEYSNLNNHPEIIKTNPLYTDSIKVNSVRGAVISGRWSKAEGRKIKKNTKQYIETQKENARIRKEQNAVKQAEKAKLKEISKQAKLKEKEDREKAKLQQQTQEVPISQPKEADVIIIKQEPKIDLDFTPVKPRLRENNFTINDL